MSGLVGYASSDEENDDVSVKAVELQQRPATHTQQSSDGATPATPAEHVSHNSSATQVAGILSSKTELRPSSGAAAQESSPPVPKADHPAPAPSSQATESEPGLAAGLQPAPAATAPPPLPNGPSLGPARFPPSTHISRDTSTSRPHSRSRSRSRSLSPHTAYRTAIQALTLPTVPNFHIPSSPSPTSSPSSSSPPFTAPAPGIDAKMAQFAKLKSQGVHFNEKLASSSALRNPSLLAKLVASAGLEADAQYGTTLSKEIWDPSGLPEWAFADRLEMARNRVEGEEKEKGKKRASVAFVKGESEGGQQADGGSRGGESSTRKSRFDRA